MIESIRFIKNKMETNINLSLFYSTDMNSIKIYLLKASMFNSYDLIILYVCFLLFYYYIDDEYFKYL